MLGQAAAKLSGVGVVDEENKKHSLEKAFLVGQIASG